MARTDHFTEIDKHCIMCGEVIPRDHPRYRLTLTDKDECSDKLVQWRKSRQDAKECRYCKRPSTPAQRARFNRWRRAEEKNPPPDDQLDPSEIEEREYRKANPPQKRGPKPQEPKPPSLLDPNEMRKARKQVREEMAEEAAEEAGTGRDGRGSSRGSN